MGFRRVADEQWPSISRIGEILPGKYRVVAELGRGGMGVVYEARHEELGRRFAVKFVHPKLTKNERALARFKREARLAGALENQHVVAVTDLGTASDGSPFIVMEYLHGEVMRDVLLRKRLSPNEACDIVWQAAVGVAAAHAQGLIHRDLKPANLFLCAGHRPLVKVLDFGIARPAELDAGSAFDTISGSTPGTPTYMSPEQARGEKRLDARTDVYALGLILYECLSGRRAHGGSEYNEILYRILNQRPEAIRLSCPDLEQGICDVLERAMAFSADDRQHDAAELASALLPFGFASTGLVSQLSLPGRAPSSALEDGASETASYASVGDPDRRKAVAKSTGEPRLSKRIYLPALALALVLIVLVVAGTGPTDLSGGGLSLRLVESARSQAGTEPVLDQPRLVQAPAVPAQPSASAPPVLRSEPAPSPQPKAARRLSDRPQGAPSADASGNKKELVDLPNPRLKLERHNPYLAPAGEQPLK